jgi:hypothetical protein
MTVRKIPKKTWKAVEARIFEAFGGWSVVGEVTGAYRMKQTGKKRVEKMLHVWVVVKDDEIPNLKEMVGEIGATLGQECMYFETHDSTIEFIPPDEVKGDHE